MSDAMNLYRFLPDDSISEIVERLLNPERTQTVICYRVIVVPWCAEHDLPMLSLVNECTVGDWQNHDRYTCRLEEPARHLVMKEAE